MTRFDLRTGTVAALLAFALAAPGIACAADDFADFKHEIARRHDESVKRLQDWIALPSIAAESLNSTAGAERMAQLARDAGFQKVTVVPTDGKPGVFATRDAGAAKTGGRYVLSGVKPSEPAGWS